MRTPAGARPPVTSLLLGTGAARRIALPILSDVPDLAHGFTVRGSDPAVVLRQAAGKDLPLARLRQVHGATVRQILTRSPLVDSAAVPLPEGDALITRLPGQALAVFIADCVPVLVCDPKGGSLAAIHAGWRGTVAGVLRETLETICRDNRARPEDLHVAFGPAIGPCCFEVGEEVVERLLSNDAGAAACVIRPSGRAPHIDLVAANRRQALACGVVEAQIQATGLCTRCETDLLESYRRSGPDAGRMAGLIAWSGSSRST